MWAMSYRVRLLGETSLMCIMDTAKQVLWVQIKRNILHLNFTVIDFFTCIKSLIITWNIQHVLGIWQWYVVCNLKTFCMWQLQSHWVISILWNIYKYVLTVLLSKDHMCLRKHAFDAFHLTRCRIYNFRSSLIYASEIDEQILYN